MPDRPLEFQPERVGIGQGLGRIVEYLGSDLAILDNRLLDGQAIPGRGEVDLPAAIADLQ